MKIASNLNRATLYGISAKVLNGINWLVVALAVSTFLSKTMQGYFFTFLSLVTVQSLFDLGLGTTVIQFAAHEWGMLPDDRRESRTADAATRLASVLRFAEWWYFLGGIALFVVLLIIGHLFFRTAPADVWPGPWLLLSGTVAADFALSAFWFVLEGCNQVRRVYRYRAAKALVLGATVWIALVEHAGLYALGLGYLVTLPLSLGLLVGPNWRLLAWIKSCPVGASVAWRREILPLQWRLAVSVSSGYAAQWGMTPVAFKLFGPVVAGQFGMIWSIINAISAVSNVVVSVRAPQYGMLIAARRYRELDRLALQVSLLSLALAFAACLAVGLGIYALAVSHSHYAERVLPPGQCLVMLAGTVLWQIASPLAIYLRSHKREPLLWLSAGFAIALISLTLAFGARFGSWGVTLTYFCLVAGFFLPGAIWVFIRCREAWHRPGANDRASDALLQEPTAPTSA